MLYDATHGDSAIVLEMPHSGLAGYKYAGYRATDGLPPWFAARVRFESQNVRRMIGFGCDAAVPELTGYPELMATLPLSGIRNRVARAFVDPNRGRDEVSGYVLKGAELRQHIHGVSWARTVPTEVDPNLFGDSDRLAQYVDEVSETTLHEPLTSSEFNDLLRYGYEPYHASLYAMHRRNVNRHGKSIHLALHSLPPFVVTTHAGGYVCGPPAKHGRFGESRDALPDIILIHNGFAAADESIVAKVRAAFEAEGAIVQDGFGPFLGDRGVTKMYGDPAQGVHVIGIEHVTHNDIEPHRHLGRPTVNEVAARKFQKAYRNVITSLL